jgi:hypothetical protein
MVEALLRLVTSILHVIYFWEVRDLESGEQIGNGGKQVFSSHFIVQNRD